MARSDGDPSAVAATLSVTLRRAERLETGWLFGDVRAVATLLLDGAPVGALRSGAAADADFGRRVQWAGAGARLAFGLGAPFVAAMAADPRRTRLRLRLVQEDVAAAAAARPLFVLLCCARDDDRDDDGGGAAGPGGDAPAVAAAGPAAGAGAKPPPRPRPRPPPELDLGGTDDIPLLELLDGRPKTLAISAGGALELACALAVDAARVDVRVADAADDAG